MPCCGEVRGRADAGEHEQLGRVDGAGGQDHLAPRGEPVGAAEGRVHDVDAGAALVRVEHQLAGAQPGQQGEVSALDDRVDVGDRAGGAGAVRAAVDLEEVGAVDHGGAGVELRAGNAGLLAGIQERDAGRVRRGHVHQVHGAGVAVVRRVGAGVLVGFQPLVQRPGCLSVPAGGAVLGLPLVQVLARGPEGDAGVVAGAAAHDLGTGVAHEGVAVLLRLDRVVPVVAGLQQLHPAVQLQYLGHAAVVRAGLHQRHGHGRVLAEPGGDCGPGGSAADDDVVELASPLRFLMLSMCI